MTSEEAPYYYQKHESSLETPLVSENYKGGDDIEEAAIVGGCSKGTTSFFKTCFNTANVLSGVGILSVPYALATGGWLSLIILFLIAAATFYTGLLIQKCMDADPTIRTYSDIGERAFGPKGRLIVSLIMHIELYLVTTGFLILEGDNLQNLFPDVGFEIAGLKFGGTKMFIVIVALVILPSVWLDNISVLSYISASGVLASVIILVSVFWVGAFDGVGFEKKGTSVNWSGIPTSISLYSFCYCAHPVFPIFYTSMKNKRQFPNVLLICFVLCTFCYASMAVFGYLMFGPDIQSQITLNLPTHKLSSKIAIYTTLVNPIAKYAIMLLPVVNATRSWFPSYYNSKIFSLLVSTLMVISTVVVALAVPFFGYLMSLVGAFLSVAASIILPCLCYLKITGNYKKISFEKIVLVGIILMGVAVSVSGTYTALVEIFLHL